MTSIDTRRPTELYADQNSPDLRVALYEEVPFADGRRGATEQVYSVYKRAGSLAISLGHAVTDIPHFLYALSVTAEGMKWFAKRGISPQTVRENTLRALVAIQAQPIPTIGVKESADLRQIYEIASVLTLENDQNMRTVQVQNVVDAILNAGVVERTRQFLTPASSQVTLDDLQLRLSAIGEAALAHAGSSQEKLDGMKLDLATLLATTGQLVASQDVAAKLEHRLKEKLSNTRTWVIASAVLALASFVMSVVLTVHVLR